MATAPAHEKKIKVLLAPALKIDGALSMDLYLENLLAAFREQPDERFDFEVITPTGGRGRLDKQWKRYVEYPRLLAEKHALNPQAILHVLDHSYGHLCRGALLSVLTCHGLENFKLRLRYPWHQWLWTYRVKSMRFARRVLAISGDTANDVRRFTTTPPERISVNYHGIEPIFNPDGDRHPALQARRAAGDLLVLHVGMNIARKNIGLIFEALAILRSEGLPVRFVKVGPDPRDDGYAAQIDGLALTNYIDYLGWLQASELAAVYRSCDVLAFPSIHEGFGRPIIEAQACGLPVVIADTASAREIAGPGAPTHPPNDAAALAGQLRTLLTQPGERARQVKTGFANMNRFSWQAHARTLMKIYQELHRTGPPPSP